MTSFRSPRTSSLSASSAVQHGQLADLCLIMRFRHSLSTPIQAASCGRFSPMLQTGSPSHAPWRLSLDMVDDLIRGPRISYLPASSAVLHGQAHLCLIMRFYHSLPAPIFSLMLWIGLETLPAPWPFTIED